MVQMGFFDIAKRYAGLDAKNDPLARIDEVVLWCPSSKHLGQVLVFSNGGSGSSNPLGGRFERGERYRPG